VQSVKGKAQSEMATRKAQRAERKQGGKTIVLNADERNPKIPNPNPKAKDQNPKTKVPRPNPGSFLSLTRRMLYFAAFSCRTGNSDQVCPTSDLPVRERLSPLSELN
jgi:hypothetical protein